MPINHASSTSPGVYTGEIDNSIRATSTPTSIGAIVGPSHRGPVNVPTLVVDEEDFENRFGLEDPNLTFMHYCAKGFLADSSRLYVVRTAVDATLGSIKIRTENNFATAVRASSGLASEQDIIFDASDIVCVYGANPGVWNDDLRIIAFPNVNDVSGKSFVLQVFEGSSAVAKEQHVVTLFDNLDGFGTQTNIENVLEAGSSLIRATVNRSHPQFGTNTINSIVSGELFGGHNGQPVTTSDIMDAWYLFEDKEDITVNIFINAGYTVPEIQQTMVDIAAQREDAFAVLDIPSAEQEAQNAVNWRRTVQNINSSFGALYAPDLLIRDTKRGRDIYIPPSGHVAGVFARTDRDAAAWFAPAGLNRGKLNVIGLRTTYKQGHRDSFDENQINPIMNRRGEGIVVWGAETLQAHKSSLSNINVRRLVNLLKTAISEVVLTGVFEPNDTFLRKELYTVSDDFLRPIKEGRGMYAYEVVCDERNNTAQTIANGDVILDIYIDPTLYTKRIHLNAIIPKTGQIKFAQELMYNS